MDLPIPILRTINPTGSATGSPGMELEWFCTTPGVERFELAVAIDEGEVLPTFGSYALQEGRTNVMEVVVDGTTNTLNFGFYRTGRVGTTFGTPGSPKFELDSSILLNRDYTVMVRAIGVTGGEGGWSSVETFRWNTVATEGPQVPWPARSMPLIQEALFHSKLQARYLNPKPYFRFGGLGSVGVQIGEIPENLIGLKQGKAREIKLETLENPMNYLFPNASSPDQTTLPFVLYRYQVASAVFPQVSGDVVQVSPMMETIAYGTNVNNAATIYDPYVAVSREHDSGAWGLFVLDTQPVVRYATYQYLLVRFDEKTKEMDRIIPAGTVMIP